METLQEIQGMEEETTSAFSKVTLVLTKGNTCVIVRDWIYPLAPTSYYHRVGLLGIEMYELDHQKDDKAYYKYVEPQK